MRAVRSLCANSLCKVKPLINGNCLASIFTIFHANFDQFLFENTPVAQHFVDERAKNKQ